MSDFSAWILSPEADCEFPGPHLVAASAGTGKTYNIQNIFARLVLEKGCRVPEILVVTFTEAATAELRERVRRILVNLRAALAGEPSASPQARALLKACRIDPEADTEATREARIRIARAVAELDIASIFTIHGFCRQCLARFAFETRFPFDQALEPDESGPMRQFAADWWRSEVLSPGGDFSHLTQNIRSSFETFFAVFRALMQKQGARVKGKLATGKAAAEETDVDYRLAQDYLNAAAALRERYAQLHDREGTVSFDDLLQGMQDALCDEKNGERFATLLRKEYRAALIDEFQDTDPVQYRIFARIFLDAPPDEQGDRPPVFFVGDPKQAIYGFRGADIRTYEAAAANEDLLERSYQLSTNFRSTPGLVEAVNSLFGDRRNFDGSHTSVFGSSRINYPEPVKALPYEKKPTLGPERRRDRAFNVVPCFPEYWLDATVRQIEFLLKDRQQNRIPDGTPEGRPVRPGDIAVLVRTNDTGKKLFQSLMRLGVPCVLSSANSVFASEEAADLQILLDAIAAPYAVTRRNRFLLGGFLNLTIEQAATLAGGPAGEHPAPIPCPPHLRKLAGLYQQDDATLAPETVPAFLEHLGRHLERDGFAPVWNEFFEGVSLGAVLGSGSYPERRLTNLLQLVEYIQTRFGARPASAYAIDIWLSDCRAEALAPPGAYRRKKKIENTELRLESDRDAVTIMTIHGSKGLEFPIVMLPDVEKSLRFGNGWGVRSELSTIDFQPDVQAQPVARILTKKEVREHRRQEDEKEQVRLLYVALTRATLALYYFCDPGDGGDRKATSLLRDFIPSDLLSCSIAGYSHHLARLAGERRPDTENPREDIAVLAPLLPPLNRENTPFEHWTPPEGIDLVAEETGGTPDGLLRLLEDLQNTPLPQDGAGLEALAPPPPPPAPPAFLAGSSFSSVKPEDVLPAPKRQAETEGADHDEDTEETSAEKTDDTETPEVPEAEEPAATIFSFPGGTAVGTCWHAIFEKIPFSKAENTAVTDSLIEESLETHGLLSPEPALRTQQLSLVADMVRATLNAPLTAVDGSTFSLADIPPADRLAEWRFDFRANYARRPARPCLADIAAILRKHWAGFPVRAPFLEALERDGGKTIPDGFFKGFLDLLFRYKGAYYIVDWKSNPMGGNPAAIDAQRVETEMAAHSYYLQYLIYAVAVRAHLRAVLGDAWSWERSFGGIRYYFLRPLAVGRPGAVFADRPSEPLLAELSELLGL